MDARNDFAQTIDHAAGLTLDATCSARAAAAAPLPPGHRRLVKDAIVALERAQQKFFVVRNHPWDQPQPAPHRQLELL